MYKTQCPLCQNEIEHEWPRDSRSGKDFELDCDKCGCTFEVTDDDALDEDGAFIGTFFYPTGQRWVDIKPKRKVVGYSVYVDGSHLRDVYFKESQA